MHVILNDLEEHILKSKQQVKLILVVSHLTQCTKNDHYKHIISIKVTDIFHVFFVLSFQNTVCILHSQNISIWIRHISRAQQGHVASGHHAGPQHIILIHFC